MLTFTKMKREIFQEIEIPENVNVVLEGKKLIVKGPDGENQRQFNLREIELKKEGNKITIRCEKATKNEKKEINTARAHVQNMINGVSKKFEYRLKVCFSHFPITVEVKGNEIIIKNFIGEKENRKAEIPHGAEVKVNKEMITVTSSSKEIAGQAAANMEQATKIRKKDRRVFQDGIFIISKAGKEI